jgi:DNA-binding XRE family transcriptional regulator
MATFAVRLENADRMMTEVRTVGEGVEVLFADGLRGIVPFADVSEIGGLSNLAKLALPNAYEIVLQARDGETTELPWDFVRPYCDPTYKPRVEKAAASGRQALGRKLRRLREEANLTQEAVASAATIGRVTLVRIERGDQSPRYETLVSLAKALNREPAELF